MYPRASLKASDRLADSLRRKYNVKSFSAALLKVLQNNPQSIQFRPDLFVITFRNGQTIYVTDGQLDLVYNGSITIPSNTPTVINFSNQRFYATKYGSWKRGKISSAATFDLASKDTDLTLVADDAVLFPGTSLPIMQALNYGLFDRANVLVLTAYMPSYGDLSLGLEIKFQGQITKLENAGRSMARWKVNDGLYLLKLPWPPNLLQSPCRHVLYNPNCTLNQASFTDNYTAASGSTQLTVNTTVSLLHSGDASYYVQGVLTWLTGQNAGLTSTVKAQASASVTLMAAALFPVATGDTFSLSAGCDKTTGTCANRFGNLIHYGGEPLVPVPEFSV